MHNLFFLLSFFFFASCLDKEPTDLVTNEPITSELPPDWRDEMLKEVNAIRQKGCNCPDGKYYKPASALRRDAKLDKSADKHAKDMQSHGFFSHTGSDGSDFSERFTKAGYKWSNAAENIAWNQPTVKEVVKAWRTSAGHCKNLMNPKLKDMGAGKSGAYWVQDLGAQL